MADAPVASWVGRDAVDWADAAGHLAGRGWARLARAVDADLRAALAGAAPPTWSPLPETEGVVRQGGLSCGATLDAAPAVVEDFARAVCDSISAARPDLAPVPMFNEAQWGRSTGGVGFITAHRDPPLAGGIIAIVTLAGRARFRIWSDDGDLDGGDDNGVTEWDTDDGDLVVLRGYGWPHADARCPVHEVGSPTAGDRMTITFRHNTAGAGADYFPG